MQFIDKRNTQPEQWDDWFLDGNNDRNYQYRTPPADAKQFLIDEQNGLCAYCQREINGATASIEHVIPNSSNSYFSTSYHNLVAVCANFIKDSGGKFHCDKQRGNSLLPALVFHKDFTFPGGREFGFFTCYSDGSIAANTKKNTNAQWSVYVQVLAYVHILNLNHENLKAKRKEILDVWVEQAIGKSRQQRRAYWDNKLLIVRDNLRHPFRQFFLIYLADKIHNNNF